MPPSGPSTARARGDVDGGHIVGWGLARADQLLLDQFRAQPVVADLERLLVFHRESGDRPSELAVLLRSRPGTSSPSTTASTPSWRVSHTRTHSPWPISSTTPSRWPRPSSPQRGSSTTGPNTARQPRPTSSGPSSWPKHDDLDLAIDARQARLRARGTLGRIDEAEELLELLEARRDPVRLKEHYFLLMWLYYARLPVCAVCRGLRPGLRVGRPARHCSRAIRVHQGARADRLGRFNEVDTAIAQEVTDDDHPFGQLVGLLARSVFLDRIGALPDALEAAVGPTAGRSSCRAPGSSGGQPVSSVDTQLGG